MGIPDTGEVSRFQKKKPVVPEPVVLAQVVSGQVTPKEKQAPVTAKGPANEPTFWDGILGIIALGLLAYGIYRFVIS